MSQTRGLKEIKCSVLQRMHRVAMENLVIKFEQLQMVDVDLWKHFGLTVSAKEKKVEKK